MAKRCFLQTVRADAKLRFAELAPLVHFRDVVDRTVHRSRAEQKARWAADRFDTFIDPAVHWAISNRVLHVDTVEQLTDRAAAKSSLAPMLPTHCGPHAPPAMRAVNVLNHGVNIATVQK